MESGTLHRKATVYYNDTPAGELTKTGTHYIFSYYPDYIHTPGARPVSITLPFQSEAYKSESLFPAFINMLSEGANKRMQCRMLKIDENDYFSLLLQTTFDDNIGPISIKEIHES